MEAIKLMGILKAIKLLGLMELMVGPEPLVVMEILGLLDLNLIPKNPATMEVAIKKSVICVIEFMKLSNRIYEAE
jgi:hypothetical protein